MTFQSDGGHGELYSQNDDITDNLSTSFTSSIHLNETADRLPASSFGHPFDTTQHQTSLEETNDGNKNMTSPPFLSPETASNQIQRRLSTGNSPHGDGTASDTLVKAIDEAPSITPDELMSLLLTTRTTMNATQQLRPLLIDIRHQPDYEDANIRGSIHVNMPSLLLKRYRRRTVSNFSLESFITTPQGMEDYSQWMKQQQQQTLDSSLPMIVVYDDVMDTTDKTTSAWTLVGALSTFFSGSMDEGKPNIKAKVVWLQGGFTAFEQRDIIGQYLEKPSATQEQSDYHYSGFGNNARQNNMPCFWNNNDPLAPTASSSSNNNYLSIPKVVPVLSRSATTFSSAPHLSSSNSNMQRRSSLFTLDTTNVRNKHRSPPQAHTTAGAVPPFRHARRRRQERNPAENSSFETTAPTPTTSRSINQPLPLTKDTTPKIPPSTSSLSSSSSSTTSTSPPRAGTLSDGQQPITGHDIHPSLPPPPPPHEDMGPHDVNNNRMDCDETFEDDGLESEQEPTPMTENEYAFIVSAIVPDFLYLGPEISTVEQMEGLKERSIQRILNMAEECDDDVPGLKATFKYSKVAARDTVEMQNVESTLRKAVRIIDDAKKHHEAIYVHCKAGKSRSVAVILAYFVLSEHWSLRRAYKHVIKARPWVSPNIGFVAELIKLEEGALGHASNFAGTDWHKVDITSPPSPASQKEIGMVQRAWRHSISAAKAKGTSSTITGSISSPASSSTPAAATTPTSSSSPAPRPVPPQQRQHRYGNNQHNRYTTS